MASLMAKYIKKYAIIQHHRVICQLILNILKILWNVIYLITNKIPEIKERSSYSKVQSLGANIVQESWFVMLKILAALRISVTVNSI